MNCSMCGQPIDDTQASLSSKRADNAQPACQDCVTRELTDRPDYRFENHGSIWLCEPTSDRARNHLASHVDDTAIWFHGALAVEPRYVLDLAEQLESDGFTTEV